AKLVIKDSKVVLKEYLSLIFTIDFLKEQIENATKSLGVPKLALSRIEAFRIPLPPPDVQKQIVQVCEAVDKDFENATKEIEMATKDIENKVNELFSYGVYKKLQDIVDINKESFNPTTKPENDFIYVDIDSVGKGTGIINYTQVIKGKNAPSRARRIAPQNSILVSTVRPYLKGFAYVDKDTEGCVFSTGFVILESKNENIISNKALYYAFMYSKSLMQQMEETMPKSAYPSINKSDIENYSLSIPDINIQKTAIKYIEQYEEIIKKAQAVIGSIPERKQEVIKKYL
ncbi:MAG: restriction endonuclease subunit S, partial [Methanosarcinales archaeon]|nr:restriction endonuclease subunit S [Methanosarcinales archaeon]